MNYVFCPSYASVFFALYLKNSGKQIKIITDNTSVEKYCRTADIDYMYFDYMYMSFSVTRFYEMFALKNRIDNLVKEIDMKKEDDFYLLDNSFDISAFYLAKEWAKRGNVYFNVLGRTYDAYKETKRLSLSFLSRTGVRYLFKMFLSLDLVFLDVHHRPAWGINDKFLKKNKIRKLSLDKNLKELQLDAMRKNQVKLGEYDNLLVSDGSLSGIVNEDSLIKVYENLLKLPYAFAVKYQPRVQKTEKLARYEELFVNSEKLPDYIPVELLFNNIRRNVVSVFSTSLIFASQLDHLKAISLLRLVEWNHESYKKETETWLMKESNNRIIFVKTFEELNRLLEA